MEQNNFSEYLNSLQEKKQNLLLLANKAAGNGWIPKSKSDGAKNIISLEEINEFILIELKVISFGEI